MDSEKKIIGRSPVCGERGEDTKRAIAAKTTQ